jgi:hypothetical protein
VLKAAHDKAARLSLDRSGPSSSSVTRISLEASHSQHCDGALNGEGARQPHVSMLQQQQQQQKQQQQQQQKQQQQQLDAPPPRPELILKGPHTKVGTPSIVQPMLHSRQSLMFVPGSSLGTALPAMLPPTVSPWHVSAPPR